MRRTAALIVGGGPAGSAAAITLARADARPLLIERDRAIGDALCGGFLSWRSLETMKRLGVEVDGRPISRVRVFSETAVGEARLPGVAIGVSRRRLDAALLARAIDAGAAVERGVAVTRAAPGQINLADGATIVCDSLFLASGKHDSRGLARPRAEGDPALGLRLRLPDAPGLSRLIGDAIELHLFRGGYAGLLCQEDGSANLCMAVRKSRLAEADGEPWTLLEQLGRAAPRLAERLAFVDRQARWDAIGAVPYGWRETAGIPGLFRLGDQAAVIPSLAGEGMSIALASGVMAAEAWLGGGAAAAPRFQQDLAARTARPVALAGRLRDAAAGTIGRALAPPLLAAFPALARSVAAATRIAA